MADIKVGVYCAGDEEVKKSVSLESIENVALKECKAVIFKTHEAITSAECVAMIKADIEAEGLNCVIVMDRSPRAYPGLFDFGEEVRVENVSLRELVIWSHEPVADQNDCEDDDTQMLAEDYLRMAYAKLEKTSTPVPVDLETNKNILVIGGGVTGLRSALNIALAGYEVVLVEKSDKLGGWSAKWSKNFPSRPPYNKLADNQIQLLIDQVTSSDKIKVHLSTTVAKIAGQPGQFDVTLRNGSGKEEVQIGSVIQATGFKPYNPKNLEYLGYGLKNVVTNVQMEAMLSEGKVVRKDNNAAPKSIAFIQCAGSRDKDHLPYCSAVCCRVSLKQAMQLREMYPDANIYVIYKDIRSAGQYELFYQAAQDDPAFFFTKGEVADVSEEADGSLKIDVDETLLGEDITVKADMLVLAAGMVPTAHPDTDLMDIPEEERAAVVEEEEGDGKKKASGAEAGAGILNLTYRQGTDLPTIKYGFPDSHFICFPYETRRTGIYAAGTVRNPMDAAQASMDADGASLKAIQAVEMAEKGQAMHPRSRDLSYPDFFLDRCTQCKRCTEDCPFGALDEDTKGTPKPNPNRCRRCGTCMGACPERIINFANFSVPMGTNVAKSASMPEEDEEKPRIIAFMCENDALPALEMAAQKRMKWNSWVRIVPVRCLGSINLVWITNCLDAGYDGIMLIGCKHGDDYQCHFVRGSELAEYRMGNVQEKLQQMALEEERVQVYNIAIDEWDKLPQLLDDYAAEIEDIGANPFKDF